MLFFKHLNQTRLSLPIPPNTPSGHYTMTRLSSKKTGKNRAKRLNMRFSDRQVSLLFLSSHPNPVTNRPQPQAHQFCSTLHATMRLFPGAKHSTMSSNSLHATSEFYSGIRILQKKSVAYQFIRLSHARAFNASSSQFISPYRTRPSFS